MKKVLFISFVLMTLILVSCGGTISKQPANKKGFTAIEKEIKNKFSDNAYYTNITISYNQRVGNIASVTVTEKPESLKMGQWNNMQGNWKQISEISLEIPSGTKASDFMFQLNDTMNLSKLGELVEASAKKLKTEKSIESPTLSMAFIKFPKNGDVSKTEYNIMLTPKNGGTTFNFRYNLNGDLIKMRY